MRLFFAEKRPFFIIPSIALALLISKPSLGQDTQREWPLYNPYQDNRVVRVGDIIQVKLDERIRSEFLFELRRDDSYTLKLNPDRKVTPFLPSVESDRSVSRKQLSDRQGGGRLRTTMAVTVRRINADGTVFVDGLKMLSFDGENSSLQLRGIINPNDLNSGNRIASSRIANLALNYQGKLNRKRYPVPNLNLNGDTQNQQGNAAGNQNVNPNQNQANTGQNTNDTSTGFSLPEQQRRQILQQYLEEILGEILDRDQQ